jgi:PAS domain-containing protein
MRDVNPLDLVETIREGILVLDPDLTIRFANRSFYDAFAVAPELHASFERRVNRDFAYDFGAKNSNGRADTEPRGIVAPHFAATVRYPPKD